MMHEITRGGEVIAIFDIDLARIERMGPSLTTFAGRMRNGLSGYDMLAELHGIARAFVPGFSEDVLLALGWKELCDLIVDIAGHALDVGEQELQPRIDAGAFAAAQTSGVPN